MNKILSFTFFMMLLPGPSCKKIFPENVKVKFTNDTEYRLEKIIIDQKSVGNLNPGETSDYITFKKVTFDGDVPVLSAVAKINGEPTADRGPWECGTMWKEKTRGQFEASIIIQEQNGPKTLYLN
jgi:hypothetical protein